MPRGVLFGDPEASFAQVSSDIPLLGHSAEVNPFLCSPVLRDAIAISPGMETEKRTLTLADRSDSLLLMFDLMENFGRKHRGELDPVYNYPSSAYVDIPVLADKYDVTWLPWVMRGHLWEACATFPHDRAFFVFGVAFKLQLRELSMHAVLHFHGLDAPIDFRVDHARELGVEAYHCLITAAKEARSQNWQDIANHIKLPRQ